MIRLGRRSRGGLVATCNLLGLLTAAVPCVIAVIPAPTLAAPDGGLALLQNAATAGQQLTYQGVFVYRRGTREETSRIIHAVVDGKQRERIEVLDGSPREVVRDGEQVRCYLPEDQLVIVENQSRRKSFPAVLPYGRTDLNESYRIRKGQVGRVAGIGSQALALEPRDEYRYGHELWIDPVSGLLLKASLLGDRGEVLESFAFTQITIGGKLDRDALVPKYKQGKMVVKNVGTNEVPEAELQWTFRNPPPGFIRTSAMRRPVADGREGMHVVFSDGLAAMSVFIEPAGAVVDAEVARVGAVHVYRRQIDGYQAVVMGEVPISAVRRLGEGIERRKK